MRWVSRERLPTASSSWIRARLSKTGQKRTSSNHPRRIGPSNFCQKSFLMEGRAREGGSSARRRLVAYQPPVGCFFPLSRSTRFIMQISELLRLLISDRGACPRNRGVFAGGQLAV